MKNSLEMPNVRLAQGEKIISRLEGSQQKNRKKNRGRKNDQSLIELGIPLSIPIYAIYNIYIIVTSVLYIYNRALRRRERKKKEKE